MLKLQNVVKNYGAFSLHCSLELKSGQISALIGQNGAGKSTTFKAILGLISIDGGEIEVLGKPVQELTPEEKEYVGVVLSDSGFSGYLNIKDILPVMDNMYTKFEKAEFLRQCQRFALPMDKQIRDFSTGMKAKLKALIALSHHAKVLILDEPTAGLDVVARDELLDLLREYMEQHEDACMLVSSHISSDLEGLCDDLYMIHEGKIVMHEDTDVLLSDYALLKMDERQYADLDKRYLLRRRKEPYGYAVLPSQKQFYMENYPQLTVEKGSIDDVIMMMIRGEQI